MFVKFERGRPKNLKGVSKALPADAFGRTTGKIPDSARPTSKEDPFKDVDEDLDENLHKWFKEKWVRFGPDGKIRGDCARGDDSEGKPKCLPQSKAQNLGKKGRASAAARKRREDPNPERSGKAINVNTKKKTDEAIDRRGFLKGMGAAAVAGAAGSAIAQSPEEFEKAQRDKWFQQVGNLIKKNTTFSLNNIEGNPQTVVEIRIATDGTLLSRKLLSSSGNKAWDEAVLKAIDKTPTFPRDSEGKIPSTIFRLSHRPKPISQQNAEPNESVNQGVNEEELDEACWKGYHKEGNKKMFGKTYPNCVKNTNEEQEHHSESCPHCGGEMVSEELMNEKKDACYYKVKSRYKVWPSAYASGALVKCRKSGADSWGNSGKKNESIEEGWQDEAQELEDWSKEVNKKLYRAHETQRPGLARQLSKLEQKHFGSSLNQGSLTEIVKAALMALQKGQMVHYDPQQVGQMPFGNIVGDEAKLIAKYNITRDELAGYRMLHDKNMVDNLEQFLKLRRLVRAKSWPLEYYEELEKLTPEEAWLKMADDLNWSKDDMNEEIQSKTDDKLLAYYAQRKAEKQKQQSQPQDQLDEKWTKKYKDSINCSNPKGFSQKAHCAGKQKNESAIMKGLK